MQTKGRFFDDFARMANGAAGTFAGVRREIEGIVRQRMERLLADMDLVTRDEFESVKEVAAEARLEQERLAARVAELESELGLPPGGKTGTGKKGAAKKASAKTASAKKAASGKAGAKKAGAKTTAAKKASAKAGAKKAGAKKAAAKTPGAASPGATSPGATRPGGSGTGPAAGPARPATPPGNDDSGPAGA